jgi:hypothetical protein
MKSLAIMQPYFFPYLGYWQLIHAVDRFIIYDDVNYIKGGWINRNRLLINGEPSYITVPLNQSSSNKRICDIALDQSSLWRNKLVKMVEMTYRKSPYFNEVFPMVEKLIRYESNNLSSYLVYQLQTLAVFMGIKSEIEITSGYYKNEQLSGQARVLDICKLEKTNIYINLQGGKTLYDEEEFERAGINLKFILMRQLAYKQRSVKFFPYLSIIDVLMEVGPVDIKYHLNAFDLMAA